MTNKSLQKSYIKGTRHASKHTIHAVDHRSQHGNRSRHMYPVQIHQWQVLAPHDAETMYYTSCDISKIASSTL